MVFENVTPTTTSYGHRSSKTTDNTAKSSDQANSSNSGTEAPTDSHALAHAEVEDGGLVFSSPGDEATSDMGWQRQPYNINEPMVGGISNEDLWMLIRRFNKQVYHVRASPIIPLDNLDFNTVEDNEPSPDKIRAHIERLYVTVIVGVASFWKHVVRLRSWRETPRTAAFCGVYFVAWLLEVLMPTMLLGVIALILFPKSRTYLFPAAPIALVSTETGGVQKPRAGILGSKDSITGAPEKHRGEAVEQEARNLVNSVTSVAAGSIVGDDAPMDRTVSDATDAASNLGDLQASASGEIPSSKHDRTKTPMVDAVWEKVKPFMHILDEINDTYERFSNALSPTPPFPQDTARIRLAGVLAPMVVITFFTSCYFVVKAWGFIFGFILFGDPIISRGTKYLNRRFPHWQKVFEIRNSLLKGVPTDAQLAITLLRLGEANGSPIPPPPSSNTEVPSRPVSIHEDIPLDASPAEIENAVKPDPVMTEKAMEPQFQLQEGKEKENGKNKGFVPAMLRFFKGATAVGVETKLASNYAMAGLGRRYAKDHLGILPRKGAKPSPRGPVKFQCRYKGKRGSVVIDNSGEDAILFFTSESSTEPSNVGNARKVLFSMPVKDIRNLKKIGGMGWKGKLIVGWAETKKEVVDGLQILGKDSKQDFRLTAIKTRNDLFNRLVALGDQIWDIV